MVVCPYCSGPHPLWECRKKPDGWKPPKKSTAALTEVHGGWRTEAAVEIAPNAPPAGTQAPPVDPKRPRGRPRTGFDKKAYDRKKAAERRANKKAKESKNAQ
jgi:hypothetical protein